MSRNRLMLFTILMLSIGFAGMTGILILTNTTGISSNDNNFNIYFSKAILDGDDISNIAISQNGKEITYVGNELSKTGDATKLDFKINNDSKDYDAEAVIECTSEDANFSKYVNVITDSDSYIILRNGSVNGWVNIKLKSSAVLDAVNIDFKCELVVNALEVNSDETTTTTTTTTTSSNSPSDEPGNISDNIPEGVSVNYSIVPNTDWPDHYFMSFSVTNNTDEDITNWTVKFKINKELSMYGFGPNLQDYLDLENNEFSFNNRDIYNLTLYNLPAGETYNIDQQIQLASSDTITDDDIVLESFELKTIALPGTRYWVKE